MAMMSAGVHRVNVDPRLRALDFWVGHHQWSEPAPSIGLRLTRDRRERTTAWARRIGELVLMVPELKVLAAHPRASVRATAARSFEILAVAGRAPADREVWRLLLGLAKYDPDADVRKAAESALGSLERHGVVAVNPVG